VKVLKRLNTSLVIVKRIHTLLVLRVDKCESFHCEEDSNLIGLKHSLEFYIRYWTGYNV